MEKQWKKSRGVIEDDKFRIKLKLRSGLEWVIERRFTLDEARTVKDQLIRQNGAEGTEYETEHEMISIAPGCLDAVIIAQIYSGW